MIRREESGGMWVIRQAAHAFVAGQIAAHWRPSPETTDLSLQEELRVAAQWHDDGWLASDQRPRINPNGLPRSFMEMDTDEHFKIWSGSIAGVFAQNRYAGLLTSLHCTALYELRLENFGDPPDVQAQIRSFLGRQHGWEEALITDLEAHPRYGAHVTPDALARNLRRLQVWDYLSLLLCMGPVPEMDIPDVPWGDDQRVTLHVRAGDNRSLLIDPYPLDGPLQMWIDAQPVDGAPFASSEALRAALERAAYLPLVLNVCPADG